MLCENIKAIRKSKGLSQEELAIKLMWCGRPSPNGSRDCLFRMLIC